MFARFLVVARLLIVLCIFLGISSVSEAFPARVLPNATCRWTGSVSSVWTDVNNWDCGSVPGSGDAVIISSATNDPIVIANTTVETLTIQNGGRLVYNAGSGVAFNITNFNIEDGGIYIHNRGASAPLSGTTVRNFSANSVVEIQDFAPVASLPSFGNLILNKASGVLSLLNSSGTTLTIVGSLIKRGSSTANFTTSANFSASIGSISVESGVLQIHSSTSGLATLNVGAVSINSGATFQRGSSAASCSFAVSGNWTNNGTWTSGNCNASFEKSGVQLLSKSGVASTESFNAITINAGTTLDVGDDFIQTVTLVNNGVLKRDAPAQTLITNTAINYKNAQNQDSLIITQNSGILGDTSVKIYDNQSIGSQTCGGKTLNLTTGINRWWDILPTGSGSAAIKFYLPNLNGILPSNVALYHCHNASWETISGVVDADANGSFIQATMSSFSPVGSGAQGALAVQLSDFSARQVSVDQIDLTWETTSELGNLGFNLWRGMSPDVIDRKLNPVLIASQAPGGAQGFSYAWRDKADLRHDVTYHYWLESVDTHGNSSKNGPITAILRQPTAVFVKSAAVFSPASLFGVFAAASACAGLIVFMRHYQ